jgi:hypothetical protein
MLDRFRSLGLLLQAEIPQGLIQIKSIRTRARNRRATIRADIPGEFHQSSTVVAGLLQLGMAIWANLPILFHAPFTSGTERQLLEGLQQGFLLKGVLVLIFQRARGTQEEVYEDPREIEDCHEKSAKDMNQWIARPPPDIAISPDNERHPKGDHKCAGEGSQYENKTAEE